MSAIDEKAKLDDLSGLLDNMLAESGGPLTPGEVRAADLERLNADGVLSRV